MMKRGLIFILAVMLVFANISVCAAVYPTYEGANKNAVTPVQRINIVYDNTDHGYVDEIIDTVFTVAAIDETSDIWLYPIAGSHGPIKIENTKEFIDKYYTIYSKPSNEFKADNVLQTACNELASDTTYQSKKFVYFYCNDTAGINSYYTLEFFRDLAEQNPDITFWPFYNFGSSYYHFNNSNIEALDDKDFLEMTLIKTGYSSCAYTYTKESGVLQIAKGVADRNIVVIANGSDSSAPYVSGYMTDKENYSKNASKGSIKGVALSYNHICLEGAENSRTVALFTADGQTVSPLEEDIVIPVINAYNIAVYYRSTPGAGVCSADTKYNRKQDDKIVNASAPEEGTEKDIFAQERASLLDLTVGEKEAEETSVFSKILNVVLTIIKGIFRIIWIILRLALFIFIVLLIAHKKFRNIVHIKILESKFGPSFEKVSTNITKNIKSFTNTVTGIKGTAKLDEKFVFISHSSKDVNIPNNRIETVVRELEKKGVKCWMAEKNIMPGQDYNAVLPEAIRNCALFILFISPNAVKSDEVVTEISTAKEYHKMIVPVQITPFDLFGQFDSWKYMLKQYQKTDLFSNKKEDVDALIKYICDIYNK